MNPRNKRSAAPYVSIIIPTWNEKDNIGKVIKGVKQELSGYSYEILVVDRYSSDGTIQIAKSLGAKVLYDSKGKGSALIKGFNAARGKIIISMDADLSNRPAELKLLITGIETGYDVCMGSRYLTGGGSDDMPIYRRLANKGFVTLVNLLYGSRYSDMCYGYRSFSKNSFRKLKLREKGFGIETEINIRARKARLRVLEVPSMEKKRATGSGKLRTWQDGYIILKTILKNMGRN
ncbi:MAG: glycosyltransferase family 2 protein [Candidatus Marsarchaeota archaeon]|nr:glycosyltransferase family 2 protein [Candidatus Marsarchaeota archaeon]